MPQSCLSKFCNPLLELRIFLVDYNNLFISLALVHFDELNNYIWFHWLMYFETNGNDLCSDAAGDIFN